MKSFLSHIQHNSKIFEEESHRLFSQYETSPSRVISVHQSRKKLNNLSIHQVELFNDSLQCIENEIYRASIVMTWAGFIDYLEQKMSSDQLKLVKQVRPGWSKFNTIEEIRESGVSEHELIKVAKEVRLLSNSEMKRLHGELSKRNDCAHPSSYNPGLNESLGYISGLLTLIEKIDGRKL